MNDESGKRHVPPPHGYITELARVCNCNRKTVTRALFKEQQGKKANEVRAMFQQLFVG